MFEPVWNRNAIDSVQITAAEDIGIGTRAGYYDSAGALRDLVQNHMLQLLCHLAMDRPRASPRRHPRREGQGAARDPRADDAGRRSMAVRAQYADGTVGGESVPGYLTEQDVPSDSNTETVRGAAAVRRQLALGRACRSTCAPASGWRARSPRSR
jgi:glucose-6-phosphate 1-dehydrogenase